MNFSLTFIKLYSTMNSLHNPVKINEFLANQKIRLSISSGLEWTRTTDLALIRRAL